MVCLPSYRQVTLAKPRTRGDEDLAKNESIARGRYQTRWIARFSRGITMIAFTFALLWRQSREISQAPRAPSDAQISSNRSDCSNKLNFGERE